MAFRCLKIEFPVERKGDQIALLKLSRPESLNALNQELVTELHQALDELSARSNLRCLVLTGDGEKSFVAGADIKEMKDHSSDQARKMAQFGQSLMQKIEEFPCPTIAAVNGFALGGGLELAMSCDFMIASSKAKFGLPEVSLGLIPGYGGTQRLSRFIGKSLARMVTLTGDLFPASLGQTWGLFALVVEPEQLMSEAMRLAEVISERSPTALRLAKTAISEGYDLSQSEGMAVEARLFGKTFETKDHVEGIQAFLEKRKALFPGE